MENNKYKIFKIALGKNSDSQKAFVKDTERYGKGVFAKEPIKKGEVIAVFDGDIYEADKCSDLPNQLPLKVRDHAIQVAENRWQDSNGFGRFMNHSCEPNWNERQKHCCSNARHIDRPGTDI